MVVYDDKGLLIESKLDLCDCLEDLCPGCHFPCLKCRDEMIETAPVSLSFNILELEGLVNHQIRLSCLLSVVHVFYS